jgi:GNAT superfamily N-acetyltransferase
MNQALEIPQTHVEPDEETDIFRFVREDDIPALLALGERFFDESEFSTFSTYSPENFERVLRATVDNPAFPTLIFAPEGTPEGFLSFQFDAPYTVEPLALGFLFYVSPEYRKSPAARILQGMANAYAKGCGAVAFYGGVMSGIEATRKTMPNLYRKLGFEELWWGRCILKEKS